MVKFKSIPEMWIKEIIIGIVILVLIIMIFVLALFSIQELGEFDYLKNITIVNNSLGVF